MLNMHPVFSTLSEKPSAIENFNRAGGSKLAWVAAVPLAPLVTVVHSVGTGAGIVDPSDEFWVTEKVGES
jgi:hypothetical protein